MKKFILAITLFSSFLKSEICHPEAGWCFSQAINFGFYIFEEANINGEELTRGVLETDGSVSCNDGECDVVGAFNGNVCVGWSTYYINDMDNKFTLAVNGSDGFEYSEGYLLNGQIPNFKFYDSSTGEIIDAESNIEIPMFQNMGGFIMGQLNAELDNVSSQLLPTTTQINSIFPNPFNPTTQINFTLHKPQNVSINIYDIAGIKIDEQNLGLLNSGYHSWQWHPTHLSSGVYFLQIEQTELTKVVLLK